MTEVDVSYEQDSVEKGFPCYEARLDEDNWMHLVHDTDEDTLWISHVWTEKNGQFSTLMDAVVQELKTNDIVFTMVISKELQESLEDFEKDTVMHEAMGEKVPILRGEWEK